MRFSDRQGITDKTIPIQIDRIDAPLRNLLWESLNRFYLKYDHKSYYVDAYRARFAAMSRAIAVEFFKVPSDRFPSEMGEVVSTLRNWFFDEKRNWWEIYNFIEFFIGSYVKHFRSTVSDPDLRELHFIRTVNSFLEQENSGFRIMDDAFVPISSETEIQSLTDSLSTIDKFSGFRTHIQTAIKLYSQKPIADYRNSIKESVSAIESVATNTADDSKVTLGMALNIIQQRDGMHESMKLGFTKLYGWTSDAGGIRHALTEHPSPSEADARFMLIACSAFGNYLIQTSPN